MDNIIVNFKILSEVICMFYVGVVIFEVVAGIVEILIRKG
jgi:hypothetical protein